MAEESRREPRGLAPALLAIVALGVFLWLGARTMKLTDRWPVRGATTVDQGVIVERTREVARLVTRRSMERNRFRDHQRPARPDRIRRPDIWRKERPNRNDRYRRRPSPRRTERAR